MRITAYHRNFVSAGVVLMIASSIGHGQEQMAGVISAVLVGADYQLPRTIGDAIHCFDPVHDQVDQHLLELDSIAENSGQRGAQL